MKERVLQQKLLITQKGFRKEVNVEARVGVKRVNSKSVFRAC